MWSPHPFSLLISFVFVFALSGYQSNASQLQRRNSTGLTDAVTWDSHSLLIHGKRVFILSAEFHPWRLPNPRLWSDVFQKIRSNGFNTVCFCVSWALHYPTSHTNGGKGDFQKDTYRDIQLFIDEAKKAGLWLIVRYDILWKFNYISPVIMIQTWSVYQWVQL